MKKVCHVCSAHPADDNRVFHRACVSLAKAGYEVHLIANSDRKEVYVEQGVTIHPLNRASNRFERFSRSAKVAEMAAAIQPDLYHIHEPELLSTVIARAKGKPVLYDVHESYMDVLGERDWIPKPLRAIVRSLWDKHEQKWVKRCAGVITVTETIASRYRALISRVIIVANFPDFSVVKNLPPPEKKNGAIIFVGALTRIRGLKEVISAQALLRKRGLEVPFVIAGTPVEYMEELYAHAETEGVRDLVEYRGNLSKRDALLLQQESSYGVVPYLPYPNNMKGMPNKLVECMAVGIPVVYSHFPYYVEIAGSVNAGFSVDPTKPQEIADALEKLVRDPELAQQMGAAGRRAIEEKYNWEHELEAMLKMYREVL